MQEGEQTGVNVYHSERRKPIRVMCDSWKIPAATFKDNRRKLIMNKEDKVSCTN